MNDIHVHSRAVQEMTLRVALVLSSIPAIQYYSCVIHVANYPHWYIAMPYRNCTLYYEVGDQCTDYRAVGAMIFNSEELPLQRSLPSEFHWSHVKHLRAFRDSLREPLMSANCFCGIIVLNSLQNVDCSRHSHVYIKLKIC